MSKSCFVISVIADKGSELREHADELFEFILAPCLEKCGYDKNIRGDHIPEPGMIPKQVVDALVEYDLVIADLTFPNPNVYYELAIRHFTDRPIIHMKKAGVKLPFDNAPVRAVEFGFNMREGKKAKEDLVKAINAEESATKGGRNPITSATNAIDPAALTRSNVDQAETLGQILNTQGEIWEAINTLSAKLSSYQLANTANTYFPKGGFLPNIDSELTIGQLMQPRPSEPKEVMDLLRGMIQHDKEDNDDENN